MDVDRKVLRILEKGAIYYELTVHKPVHTSEEAAKVRNVPLRTGVKAMVLKTDGQKFLIALVPANRRVDMAKVATLEGIKEVGLASPKEVLDVTGCEVGSVPPFGHIRPLPTYFDLRILKNKHINFNAGKHTISVHMESKDLPKCIEMTGAEFLKEKISESS